MSTVMDMSSHEIEADPATAEYNEYVEYSGWNPAVALVCQPQPDALADQPVLPPDLATEDVNLFLDRIYACQR